jgi:hypothetical protein
VRYTLTLLAAVVLLAVASTAMASEKRDIYPGTENWHRFRFFVFPISLDENVTAVAVQQSISVLWDNPPAAMLMAIYDTTDPADLTIEAISVGNDRQALLEIGLMEGTYELVLATVGAPTHYHMNVLYGSDEFLFQQPNGTSFSASQQASDLEMESMLAPYVRRLEQAVGQ